MKLWRNINSLMKNKYALTSSYVRCLCTSPTIEEKYECKLLVLGGGTGGCSTAATFASKLGTNNVIVIEKSDRHYYQPMFTLVGAGVKSISQTVKPMSSVLPRKALWLQAEVKDILPDECEVLTNLNQRVKYEYLVIALGIYTDFDSIPGMREALDEQDSGVCSIYSPKYATKTFESLKSLKSGKAIFTYPRTQVKCAGAPQKITYLTAHYVQLNGLKDVQVVFRSPLPFLFGNPYYVDALWKVVEKRNVQVELNTDLVEIRPNEKKAVFRSVKNKKEFTVEEYAMLHVVPPQHPPEAIRKNSKLCDLTGYLAVDKETMQHKTYKNIFGIGDCVSVPTSKTAAAAAAQLAVINKNLTDLMAGKSLPAKYDGYTSCPLVTGYGGCIMSEFGYDLRNLETFPFDQRVERKTMYLFKKHILPIVYFDFMLKGYYRGPKFFRKVLNPFGK